VTVLRTERLLLRQWRDDDRHPWAALNADPLVMEHFPSTLSRAESDHWAAVNTARIADQGWGLWAVEVIGGPSFIGFTGLLAPDFDVPGRPEGCVEIGWRLAAEHWGRGYAPEAAAAVLAHAFGELAWDEVVSFTAVGNVKSRRVMEKLGMVHERDFDHPKLPGDPLERHALYRIGRTDWQGRAS
jgi:RimJ/RimL family protein N-acetyltransferase